MLAIERAKVPSLEKSTLPNKELLQHFHQILDTLKYYGNAIAAIGQNVDQLITPSARNEPSIPQSLVQKNTY